MAWTDPTLNNTIKDKKVHVTELVDAVTTLGTTSKLSSKLTLTGFSYDKVNSVNLKLLQNAVHTLQTNFSNNCCQSECDTQSCQSCQKCQLVSGFCSKCYNDCYRCDPN